LAQSIGILGIFSRRPFYKLNQPAMEEFNRANFASVFGAYLDQYQLPIRSVAAAIGCSEPTMNRLLGREVHPLLNKPSLPTDEMLRQAGVMMTIGYIPYSRLSKAEKARVSETIGTVVGGSVGFATIGTAVAGFGSVAGVSAAGISSGLAAMGGIIGGGMLAGVAVAAAIPVAVGTAGLGVGKGIKHVRKQISLNSSNFDPKWEMVVEE
jgi:hypothetical protein